MLSDCSVLNDPYEGMYAFVDKQTLNKNNEIFKCSINRLINQRNVYIQSSFSYDFDNLLMWGHYANGCRGYCIEYTVNSKDYLFPVKYVEQRPLLSSLRANEEVEENLQIIKKGFSKVENDTERFEYMLYIQAIKSLNWSYEKEIRLVDFGNIGDDGRSGNVDSGLYGLEISKIIIGCHCKYRQEVIDIAAKLKVPVSIMEIPLYSKKYQLIEKEIIK